MFIRTCSLKRFPTKEEAVAHTRAQAAEARVGVVGNPNVTQGMTAATLGEPKDVWLVEFSVAGEKKRRPRRPAKADAQVGRKRSTTPRKRAAAPRKRSTTRKTASRRPSTRRRKA